MDQAPLSPAPPSAIPVCAVPSLSRDPIDRRFWRGVIEAGCAAPSADNNQPWKFRLTEQGVDLHCDLARRLPSDVEGMFDLLSLGAVIENICQHTSAQQLKANVTLADTLSMQATECHGLVPVATIRVDPTGHRNRGENLADFIYKRHTTRTPFSTSSLRSELPELESVIDPLEGVHIDWVSKRPAIKRIAAMVALADSLRFRYRDFHEELHRQLRLSAAESEATRDGLDYRTLGLPPGARWVLRWLRPWQRMAWLNRFGAAEMFSLPSLRLVRASGAIGFLSIDQSDPQSMIAGGRVMQRLWLKAEQLGLALHPLGSVPIFLAHQSMPTELGSIVLRVRQQAERLIPQSGRFLQMAFRLGHGATPTTRSLRRGVVDVTISDETNYE